MIRRFRFRQPSVMVLKYLAQIKGAEKEVVKCLYHTRNHLNEETQRAHGKALLDLNKPLSGEVLQAIAMITPNAEDTLRAFNRLMALPNSDENVIAVLEHGKKNKWKARFMDKMVRGIFAQPSKRSIKLLGAAIEVSPYRSNVIDGMKLLLARKGSDAEIKKLIEYARRNFRPITRIMMETMYAVRIRDWEKIGTLISEARGLEKYEEQKSDYVVNNLCTRVLAIDFSKMSAEDARKVLSSVFINSRMISLNAEALKKFSNIKGSSQEMVKLLEHAERYHTKAAKMSYCRSLLSLKTNLPAPVLAVIVRMAPDYRDTLKAFRKLVDSPNSDEYVTHLLWFAQNNKWSSDVRLKMSRKIIAVHSKVSANVLLATIKYAPYQDTVLRGLRLLLKREDAEPHVRKLITYSKSYFGEEMQEKIEQLLEPYEANWALNSRDVKRIEELIRLRGGKKGSWFEEMISKKAVRFGGEASQLSNEILGTLARNFYYLRPSIRVLRHLSRRKGADEEIIKCLKHATQYLHENTQSYYASIILGSKVQYSAQTFAQISRLAPDSFNTLRAFKKLITAPKSEKLVEELLIYAERKKWDAGLREKMVKSIFVKNSIVSASMVRLATERSPYQRNVLAGLRVLMRRSDGGPEIQKMLIHARKNFSTQTNDRINKILGVKPSITSETHSVPSPVLAILR